MKGRSASSDMDLNGIDAKLEAKLGFDRIREAVSDRCATDYAATRVLGETFCTDEAEIRRRLALTDEMRMILMFEDAFPTGGYIDGNGPQRRQHR